MIKKIAFTLCLAATSLLITQCSNDFEPRVTRVGKAGDIAITDLRSSVVNNLLTSQAVLYNTASHPITGFYRCQFFDVNKMQLDGPEIWQPVTLYPNEKQTIKCAATQLEAIDFNVEFSTQAKNVELYKN